MPNKQPASAVVGLPTTSSLMDSVFDVFPCSYGDLYRGITKLINVATGLNSSICLFYCGRRRC